MASKHSSGSRSIVDVAGFPDYIRKFLQNSEVNESDPTAILQLLIKSNLVTLVQQEGNETIISIKPDEDLPLVSRENLDRDNSTLDSPACASPSSILQDWEFTQEELLVPDAQPVRDNVVSRQNRSNSTGNISVIYVSNIFLYVLYVEHLLQIKLSIESDSMEFDFDDVLKDTVAFDRKPKLLRIH
ncbi:uncharacterized protein LOC129728928 [Wyeomyia smithii]|uniref:uncharacterized protein LOC129728928 n=1 Tax=Wyeomyia smithii TaxID=174621 RepID=UPI002467BDF2|nr:uncharacterized protein LOC129728928 [Wyeomyia smithii]